MNRYLCLAAMTAAFTASSASGLVNINLNDGSASFSTVAAGFFGAPFDSASALDTNLYADGASSFDYLAKYCWYYRTIDAMSANTRTTGGTVPFSNAGAPVVTGSGNTENAFWGTNAISSVSGAAKFSGNLAMTLNRNGTGKLNTVSTMTITADASSAQQQVYEIFCLLDPTVSVGVNNGTSDSGSVSQNGNVSKMSFGDGSGTRYVEFLAKDATRYELATSPVLRSHLGDGTNNNLNNIATTGGVDAAGAYQWTLVLNPGESRTLETAFSVNMPASFVAVVPEPSTLGVLALAIPLIARRRK